MQRQTCNCKCKGCKTNTDHCYRIEKKCYLCPHC